MISKITSLLFETAAIALRFKARISKRIARRNASRKIYANHERELEGLLEEAITPLIEEQVVFMEKRLLSISEKKKEKASALVKRIFDPKDKRWKEGLQDRALPVMVVTMLKSMKAAMVGVGIDPTKGMKKKKK